MKMTNLDKYKKDLNRLISIGHILYLKMVQDYNAKQFEEDLNSIEPETSKQIRERVKKCRSFHIEYQTWYSESKALIRQLLPDRFDDFVGYYDAPKNRKEIDYENYRISDYLTGLSVKRNLKEIVGPDAAIPRMQQQNAIVQAVKKRFESSLFDIKQLVQADLFDSELDTSQDLLKKGFLRAAGAVAGVVIEKHLAQVCDNHQLKTRRKPTIATYNDMLKNAGVVDISQWRTNQLLSDIRNMCVHNKKKDPTKEQVTDLVDGAIKITKTLF